MRAALVLAMLAACGDDLRSMDPALTGACSVDFTGNFTEASFAPESCPKLDGSSISFALHPAALDGETFAIVLDLGAGAAPGLYTAATVSSWNAFGIGPVANGGGCVIDAGTGHVPPGWFTLDFDGVHGHLDISAFVLAIQGSDCGPGDREDIAIEF